MTGKGSLNMVLRKAGQELKPADVKAHELSCLKILRLYVRNIFCAYLADASYSESLRKQNCGPVVLV